MDPQPRTAVDQELVQAVELGLDQEVARGVQERQRRVVVQGARGGEDRGVLRCRYRPLVLVGHGGDEVDGVGDAVCVGMV